MYNKKYKKVFRESGFFYKKYLAFFYALE